MLGLWAGEHGDGEGAKYWLRVLTEIKNRGVRDVCMLVCDGLKGLPDAVSDVWEKTIVHTRNRTGEHWRIARAAMQFILRETAQNWKICVQNKLQPRTVPPSPLTNIRASICGEATREPE